MPVLNPSKAERPDTCSEWTRARWSSLMESSAAAKCVSGSDSSVSDWANMSSAGESCFRSAAMSACARTAAWCLAAAAATTGA
eukprot:scaffold5235_cov95-Isochrysis_galbana.AAC.2